MMNAYTLRNHFTLGNYNTTITRAEFESSFTKTAESVTFTFGGGDGKSYEGVRFVKVGKGLHYIMEDELRVEKATGESHPEASWLVDVERA